MLDILGPELSRRKLQAEPNLSIRFGRSAKNKLEIKTHQLCVDLFISAALSGPSSVHVYFPIVTLMTCCERELCQPR